MAHTCTTAIAVGWLKIAEFTHISADPKTFQPRPSGSEKLIATRRGTGCILGCHFAIISGQPHLVVHT